MSTQNNWNNPDMYYQQPGPADAYNGSNVNYAGQGYGSNAANGATTYGANGAPTYGANAQFAGAGPGYVYQPLAPTNTLAIIALCASIFGMSGFFLSGIAGIIMGHIARKQIQEKGERGDGMVTAALWVGYIGTGLWLALGLLIVLFYAGMFAVLLATGTA